MNIKFDGSDWTELVIALGIEPYPSEISDNIYYLNDFNYLNDKAFNEYLDWLLFNSICGRLQDELKEFAATAGEFLIALAEKEEIGWGYSGPLWIGLAAIKNDFSMARFFPILFRSMWA
ncbi:MAG: hypothetical protein ACOC5T_02685 [Elusimicrobiota bacterium]